MKDNEILKAISLCMDAEARNRGCPKCYLPAMVREGEISAKLLPSRELYFQANYNCSNCAYSDRLYHSVPLSPEYPQKEIDEILEISGETP